MRTTSLFPLCFLLQATLRRLLRWRTILPRVPRPPPPVLSNKSTPSPCANPPPLSTDNNPQNPAAVKKTAKNLQKGWEKHRHSQCGAHAACVSLSFQPPTAPWASADNRFSFLAPGPQTPAWWDSPSRCQGHWDDGPCAAIRWLRRTGADGRGGARASQWMPVCRGERQQDWVRTQRWTCAREKGGGPRSVSVPRFLCHRRPHRGPFRRPFRTPPPLPFRTPHLRLPPLLKRQTTSSRRQVQTHRYWRQFPLFPP